MKLLQPVTGIKKTSHTLAQIFSSPAARALVILPKSAVFWAVCGWRGVRLPVFPSGWQTADWLIGPAAARFLTFVLLCCHFT